MDCREITRVMAEFEEAFEQMEILKRNADQKVRDSGLRGQQKLESAMVKFLSEIKSLKVNGSDVILSRE